MQKTSKKGKFACIIFVVRFNVDMFFCLFYRLFLWFEQSEHCLNTQKIQRNWKNTKKNEQTKISIAVTSRNEVLGLGTAHKNPPI